VSSVENQEKQPQSPKPTFERTLLPIVAEVLFVLLPMIVIGIVLGLRGEIRHFIYIPEWSLVNAVIVGQSVMKMFYGTLRFKTSHSGTLILTVAIAIVLLLVPTLIVLAFILVSSNVSSLVAAIQLVLFACGLYLYGCVLYQFQLAAQSRGESLGHED
jgi:RsiW-degrading membrane proteinase PrsW (M82 family)